MRCALSGYCFKGNCTGRAVLIFASPLFCVQRVGCPEGRCLFFPPFFLTYGKSGCFQFLGCNTNALCDIAMGRDIGRRTTVPKSCDKTWFKALSVPMPCLFSIKKYCDYE